MNVRKMNTAEKKAARFIFLPRLHEIAKRDNSKLLNMEDIGQQLGFDCDLTNRMEKYLIDENLIKLNRYRRIVCSNGQEEKEVAFTSTPRIVTEVWDKTVFAVFDNKKLKSELEKWVIENNCELCWGVPRTPDIIAIPYFVSVIDRDILGEEAWETYLGYRDNDGDVLEYWHTSVCIIVDNKREMELPKYDQVLCVDLRYEESIRWVINLVDIAKKMSITKKRLLNIYLQEVKRGKGQTK